MAGRRLTWLVLLTAACILYIFYEAFLSWYLLLAVLLCPVLSLVISLPGMLRAALTISVPEETTMGQTCILRVQSARGCLLPFGRLTFTAAATDLTGRYIMQPKDYTLSGYGGSSLNLHTPAVHCGGLQVEISRACVTDLLGLFSRKLRPDTSAVTLVLPVPVQPEILPSLPETGPSAERARGGPAEDYDLRPYRSGDAARSIHWKLSARTDGLIVREALVPADRHLELAIAFGGTQAQMDSTLSHLLWLSRMLLEREIPHSISWLDAEQALQQQEIAGMDALRQLLKTLLLSPAPENARYPSLQGAFLLDRASAVAGEETS